MCGRSGCSPLRRMPPSLCLALAAASAVAEPPHPWPDPIPANNKSVPAPGPYIVDLDLAPRDRWTSVATEYKTELLFVINVFKSKIPKLVLPGLEALGDVISKAFPAPYPEEMQGVADAVGVPVADVMMMNLFYEVSAACTSIVGAHANGTIYHGRNLDFGIAGLQNITVDVHFARGGAVEYVATTYVGYVGVLTGMRAGAFTLTTDQRDIHPLLGLFTNLREYLLAGGQSVGFFLRKTLDEQRSFDAALPVLQSTPLIAPSYIIIGGTRNQAAVITRDRQGANDTWQIDPAAGRWFLVETNYDHWVAPPASDNRRDPANARMAVLPRAGFGAAALSGVLSQFPNLIDETTYQTTMSADTGAFNTTVHNLGWGL